MENQSEEKYKITSIKQISESLLQITVNSVNSFYLRTNYLENLNINFDIEVELTKTDFEDGITDNINRIFKQISECLKLAQTEPEKIELIVLTGGSTQIKLIQNLISARFPNALISQEDKFSSVSTGLAYDSMRKFK